MIVAIAAAIAFHEVLLALVHGPATPSDTETEPVTTQIVLQPRPTPRPTPVPTPRPTVQPTPEPRRTPPRSTPAPARQIAGRAKGRPAHHHGGGAHHAVPRPAAARRYADVNAQGVGTGHASGTGPGAQPGNGGQNGNGNGNEGNGNGAVNAETPCGVVEFQPIVAPKYSNGAASETVEAKVSFPDGHQESAVFPYPWIYPDGEQNDPWSSTNLKNPNYGDVTLRFPPPGADPSTYPPLIQYILKHTDAGGFTKLVPCPGDRR